MTMKTKRIIPAVLVLMTMVMMFQSCDNDNDEVWYYPSYPNALVTIKPIEGGAFYMQLDDKTTLFPTNVKKSPYKDKEVRALTRYSVVEKENDDYTYSVLVHWIDSILTKPSVQFIDEQSSEKYGEDPVEIVNDWVTVAEDGYLTLRFRTRWGGSNVAHFVNLLTGVNPDNPYEVEFRHNAYGDVSGALGDALVAFRLNDLPDTNGETVTLTLKYQSFSGPKKIEFDYCSRKSSGTIDLNSCSLRGLKVK